MSTFDPLKALRNGGVCIACLIAAANVSGQQFTPLTLSIPPLRYASVAWGDFDNDGDLDLLVSGDTGSGLVTRIYRNDGSGNFVDIQAGLPGVSSGAVAWGDYNGDGYLDFAMTGATSTGRLTRIYRNNGNGTFTAINVNIPGLDSARLTWVDFDNDGDLDLFVVGYTGTNYFARIYRNDGNDKFSDSGVTSIAGGAAGSAAWADFDNDGDQDLLFAGFTGDTTYGQSSRLYRNSNGIFTIVTGITLTAMSQCSAGWEDYDNDGNLDLLMAGSSIAGVQSYPTLRLYHNNGNGVSFTSVSTSMSGLQNCSVAWGDFDNDGYPDIAVAGYDTTFAASAHVYRNLGGGAFSDTGAGITGVFDAALAWGDFDGDGDLDLLVTGFNGATNVIRLYRNNEVISNTVPSAPSGLGSMVNGKALTLTWNAGSDGNQSGGFTYNVRVGTSPGSDNIMASQADPTTGFRRLPALGNANTRLSWTLRLPVGTYYWSVQTIDHSFAGSPFAAEQMVTIPAQAPDVTTLAATNVTLNTATLQGIANPNGASTAVYFEYGTDTNYGVTTHSQNIGSGAQQVSAATAISNLPPGLTYQFRAIASNSLGITYGSNQSFTTPPFIEVAGLTLLGVGAGSAAWGDYDNDGFLDLLITGGNSTNRFTRIYRNLGGTNFVDIHAGLPGISSGQAVWGDFDNDGRLDVLLTGSGISRIYHNAGNNVFTDVDAGLPGMSTGASAAWADWDNDGALDFAMTGGGGFPFKIYRNDGSRFTDVTNTLPQLSDSSIAWADYNNDGNVDLLISGYNYGAGGVGELTRLYRNDGHGDFTNSNISFQGVSKGSVAWGDYNNDGMLDLLLTGSIGSGLYRYSMIYSNTGAGTFVSRSLSTVAKMDQSCVAWGDYNNDGMLDFAACGMTSTGAVVKVYRNDGGTVFHDSGASLPGLTSASLAWGDFDNDGRLDLLVSGYDGSNYVTKIYRNMVLVSNTPPSAPGSLSSLVNNDSVTLNWGSSTDPNQNGGLTYNLRIGSSPGVSDVLGPMAAYPGGFRCVPRLGNAGTRLTWTITNLNVGTFYWSVQAIDHNFAGSPFAPEASFSIAPRAPRAVTGIATNITANSALLTGAVNPDGSNAFAYFEYGSTTNYGSRTAIQVVGAGTVFLPVSLMARNLAIGSTNHYRLVATNNLGVAYGQDAVFSTLPQFTEIAAVPHLAINYFSQWGDYNGDGKMDILYMGSDGSGNFVRIIRNDGSNGFAIKTNATLPQIAGAVAWGDFDGDGKLDFACCGQKTYSTEYSSFVYHNDGGGVFTDIGAGLSGVSQGASASWVDFDNDGDLDLFLTGRTSGSAGFTPSCRLYRNDGSGVFTPVPIPMPGVTSSAVAWGDYDNDGLPDLLMTGATGSNFVSRIYHNDGGGHFSLVPVSLPGVQNGTVAWGDFDNDGFLDFVLAGDTGSGYVAKLYRNDGSGRFVEMGVALPGVTYASAAWGDYDNDGRIDLLLTGTTNGSSSGSITRLYHNLGAGTFVDSGWTLPALYAGSASWADYGNDGNLDILLVGPPGTTRLLHNNQSLTNQPPAAPSGLTTTVVGSSVALTWNAATDPNQSGGLSYNLRVGTGSGLGNIVSPQANPSTGLRYLPQLGNADECRTLTLTNLLVGTYYWSVQAVDAAFAGSPFAPEANFIIPPRVPDAVTLTATNISFDSALLRGIANANGSTATAFFQYGTTTNYGSKTNPQNVGSGAQPQSVSASLSNLTVGVTYSFRLVVSNALGVAYGTNRTFTTPWFTEVATGLPQVNFGLSVWGDFNNDGVMDVFIMSSSVNAAFAGSGNGTFTNAGFAFSGGTTAAWGDYNNDGNLDLLVAGSTATYVYRNNGTNSFTLLNLGTVPTYNNVSAAWGDYDNDGRLDFVLCGENKTQLFHNLGSNQFADSGLVLPGVYGGAVSWVDYDNDGNLDLLLTGSTSPNYDALISTLYRNDGHGGFTNSGAILPGMHDASISWADYDQDGRLDLLMSGTTITGAVTVVYHNDGGGVFHDINAGLPATAHGTAAWGDFNNDGYPDILLTAIPTGGALDPYVERIYQNNGDGTFTAQDLPFSGWYGDRGAWADYDNDGDLDVMVVGANDAATKLFRNNAQVPDRLPAPPSGLVALPNGNGVELSWDAATDSNQNAGLTYNIRVGTSPGASDVVGPMSDNDTGFRRLPALGNAGLALDRRVTNLSVGTYYWSVQAVDNSYAGSVFAPEASFHIFAQAPGVIAVAYSNLVVDGVTLNGRVNPNEASTLGYFEYGLTTNYSLSTAPQNLGSGTNWLTLSAVLTGLQHATLYHYRVVASNSFGVHLGPDQTFATPQFTAMNLALVAAPGAFASGDFNNDENMDFLFTANVVSYTRVYLGSGTASFSDSGIQLPGLNYGSAEWGDFDLDGNLDVVLSGWPLSTCTVYRNTGANNLTNINASLAPGAGQWGDADNDGRPDLIGSGNGAWQLYHNQGNGQFTLVTNYNGVEGNIAWGDYDNDGHLDFVISGIDTNGNAATRLFHNNGHGGFTLVNAGLANVNGHAAWGDYDNDGDLDLLLSGATNNYVNSPSLVKLYRNDNGVFTEVATDLPNVDANILWADYDNDGKLDIIMSGVLNWPAIAAVFHNDGNGAFHNIHAGWIPTSGDNALACGDFDNNGALDFLVAGYTGSNYVTRLYLNNASRSNTPPSAPTGLTSLVTGNSATLTWSPATDAQQAGGLSYNLRVGTAPGKADIVNPLAFASGRRKVPRLGNVQENLSWTVTNLPAGTYYWSVQAVDNSYAGSPFAPEQSFVRGTQPTADPQTIMLPEDTARAITLTGTDPDGQPLTFSVLTQPEHGTLSGIAPNLLYQTFTNYFGADGFSFDVSNGSSSSAPAQVKLTITQVADIPVATLSITRTNNGYRMTLLGEPYDRFGIMASEDLKHWELVTNLIPTNGPMPFIDPDADLYSHRFYRSVLQLTAPQLSLPRSLSNGSFQFDFAADPGRYYQLLASTNLIDWSILTNLPASGSNVLFLDPDAAGYSHRFYQVIPVQ